MILIIFLIKIFFVVLKTTQKGHTLYNKDLNMLNEGKWLNDSLINFANEYTILNCKARSKLHAFPCHFLTTFMNNGNQNPEEQHRSVKGCTQSKLS
jgi:Ulp1 family protease